MSEKNLKMMTKEDLIGYVIFLENQKKMDQIVFDLGKDRVLEAQKKFLVQEATIKSQEEEIKKIQKLNFCYLKKINELREMKIPVHLKEKLKEIKNFVEEMIGED